ncbi:Wzz/FepE/Etk N-terminal domain-containing protein [Pseudoalteromonas pernae]|uniref:Wzz/FepE/Etk N-terminal domain-containing protein n=1 Tax=Pseudoalteromonas pernae TaxID=3118054 RepID=UPI003241EE70
MEVANVQIVEMDAKLSSFLFDALNFHKWKILFTIILFSVAGVVYSLSLPNVYKSTALMAPSESEGSGGVAGMLGSLSGVASLAGVNLPGGEEEPFHVEERLKSRDFIIPFIDRHDLKGMLFSSQKWERDTNKIVFDSSIYNAATGQWTREVKPGRSIVPSGEEAYKKFRDFYSVTYDRKRNIFKISFEFISPSVSQDVLNDLIMEFNLFSKEKKLAQINKNIAFVQAQIDKAEYVELKQVLYSVLEEQLKSLMMTQSKDDYTLSLIQAPFYPEEKSSPSRAFICILFFILGGLLSYSYALIMTYRKSQI